jgi:transcriptional regulator with XRE-family HTH domain
MAEAMGVSPRTYAYYEQGDRVPDAESLARLVEQGWSANWLLTGEGPERLNQVAQPRAAYGSQPVSPADLSIALQLANAKIEADNKAPTPDQYAAFVASILEAVQKGLPDAEVLDFSTGQRIPRATEDQADDGRQGMGGATGRPAGGDAGQAGGGKR